MIYDRMVPGTFLERPNRFIAYVEIEGRKETVHVKNTGRCAARGSLATMCSPLVAAAILPWPMTA